MTALEFYVLSGYYPSNNQAESDAENCGGSPSCTFIRRIAAVFIRRKTTTARRNGVVSAAFRSYFPSLIATHFRGGFTSPKRRRNAAGAFSNRLSSNTTA